MLELLFLGPAEVRVNKKSTSFKTRKSLAVLAYLAAQQGPRPREHLAAMLWPDADDEAARASLRSALVHAREALGTMAGRLEADRLDVALRLEPGDLHDLKILEDAARESRRAADSPAHEDAVLQQLRGSLALVRGDFLQGLRLEEGAGSEWMLEQRSAARRWTELVASRLVERELKAGEYQAAVEAASRWVALDRLSEEAWRSLATAYLCAGQRSSARDALAECRRMMREEFGLAPTPETRALEARLARDGSVPGSKEGRALNPSTLLVAGALAGRRAEMGHLQSAYEAAAGRSARAVLISGEPGIGKTRLAREFLGWAEEKEAVVLRGRAFEASGLTYGAIADALRQFFRLQADPVALLARTWLAELAALVPDLRDRIPDLPPALSDPGLAKGRLLEALAELILGLASRAPVILMVDDLQWTDNATREALRYVARRAAEREAAVLVLLTVRTEALSMSPDLVASLSDLAREMPISTLQLEALTSQETTELVDGLGIGEAGASKDELTAWLYARTGGQPLYLAEVIKSLAERGAFTRTTDGLGVDLSRLDGADSGLNSVISGRLARLSPEAAALSQASAVLGDHAKAEVLIATAALGQAGGVSGLEQLLNTGLLRQVADGKTVRYSLSHDRVRETVYQGLGALRRAHLHGRALEALERLSGSSPDEMAPMLAWHAEEAGDLVKAGRYFGLAGLRAEGLGASRDAVPLLKRALELLPCSRESLDFRLDLISTAGAAIGAVAGLEALLDFFQQTAERAAARGAADETARINGDSVVFLGSFGRFEHAERLARDTLALARATGSESIAVDAYFATGIIAGYRGDLELAEREFLRSIEIGRRTGFTWRLGAALSSLATVVRARGDWATEDAYRREALAVNLARNDAPLTLQNLRDLATAAEMDGSWEEATRLWREADRYADLKGQLAARVWALTGLGTTALASGNLGESLPYLQAAYDLTAELVPSWSGRAAARLGLGLARSGDEQAARALLAIAERSIPVEVTRMEELSRGLGLLGDLRLEVGDVEKAVAAYRDSLAKATKWSLPEKATALAAALEQSGDLERSAEFVGALLAGPPLRSTLREKLKATLTRLRSAMSQDRLERTLERGRAKTLRDLAEEVTTRPDGTEPEAARRQPSGRVVP